MHPLANCNTHGHFTPLDLAKDQANFIPCVWLAFSCRNFTSLKTEWQDEDIQRTWFMRMHLWPLSKNSLHPRKILEVGKFRTACVVLFSLSSNAASPVQVSNYLSTLALNNSPSFRLHKTTLLSPDLSRNTSFALFVLCFSKEWWLSISPTCTHEHWPAVTWVKCVHIQILCLLHNPAVSFRCFLTVIRP